MVRIITIILAILCIAWTPPNRIIVPLGAGNNTDIIARLITKELPGVVVENKPGAGSTIGTDYAIRNNQLLFTSVTLVSSPIEHSYDIDKDLIPIAIISETPMALVSKKYKTMDELFAANNLSYAIINYGGPTHYMSEAFIKITEMSGTTKIPYKSTPEAVVDLLAGRVDFAFLAVQNVIEYAHSGELNMLAFTKNGWLYDVNDEYIPEDMQVIFWTALFAPKDTPSKYIKELQEKITKLKQSVLFTENIHKMSNNVWPVGNDKEFIKQEVEKYKELSRKYNIK